MYRSYWDSGAVHHKNYADGSSVDHWSIWRILQDMYYMNPLRIDNAYRSFRPVTHRIILMQKFEASSTILNHVEWQ